MNCKSFEAIGCWCTHEIGVAVRQDQSCTVERECFVPRDTEDDMSLTETVKNTMLTDDDGILRSSDTGAKDKKYDQGKAMVGLMKKDFSKALHAVAVVATYGVKKYNQPGSWRYVDKALVRYEDALGRHDLLMNTEDYDDESHILHAAHRAWNALATLEMILDDKKVSEDG